MSSGRTPTGWPRTCGGFGFITADKIARQMGIDEHSPHRAQAALEHLLLEQAGEGHVFTPDAEPGWSRCVKAASTSPRSC